MIAGEDFDSTRLVEPGEWDELAGGDDKTVAEMDTRISVDLAEMAVKEEVKREEVEPAGEVEATGVRQTHMSFEWSDGSGESDFNQLLGKRVRIVGLTGRPELNGCVGARTLHAQVFAHVACARCMHTLRAHVACTLSEHCTCTAHCSGRARTGALAGRVYSWHEDKGRAGVMRVPPVECT